MFFKHDKYLNLKYYISNIAILWLFVFFYRYNNYYQDFLFDKTQFTILILALTYTCFGFVFYIILSPKNTEPTKCFLLLQVLKRYFFDFKKFLDNPQSSFSKISHEEKTAILFIVVKILFVPMMLNFFFGNYQLVSQYLKSANQVEDLYNINNFSNFIYPLAFYLLLLVDTIYFSFGYLVEAKFLKNKVRSVEPTFFGWIVAILCYPPFNGLFSNIANWYANEMILLNNAWLNFSLKILIILFLIIYVLATVALGAKCSNLTNRGIVSRGPYAFVRHPAYIAKNIIWWITIIPVMSVPAFFSMTAWTIIYFLRAVTEERHLIKDPEYQEYVKKVKYRFIPWVF